jgi:hypothetical protein
MAFSIRPESFPRPSRTSGGRRADVRRVFACPGAHDLLPNWRAEVMGSSAVFPGTAIAEVGGEFPLE